MKDNENIFPSSISDVPNINSMWIKEVNDSEHADLIEFAAF